MIVFSRLTTRMIVHDSFSVSCFSNHRPDSGQKTCCRPLSSRTVHTFASLSYGTPFSVHIFTPKELGTRCPFDFACATGGELSMVNYHEAALESEEDYIEVPNLLFKINLHFT